MHVSYLRNEIGEFNWSTCEAIIILYKPVWPCVCVCIVGGIRFHWFVMVYLMRYLAGVWAHVGFVALIIRLCCTFMAGHQPASIIKRLAHTVNNTTSLVNVHSSPVSWSPLLKHLPLDVRMDNTMLYSVYVICVIFFQTTRGKKLYAWVWRSYT